MDIMYSDKTEHGVTMSKVVTRYLNYIEELYQLIEYNIDKIQIDEEQLKKNSLVLKFYDNVSDCISIQDIKIAMMMVLI